MARLETRSSTNVDTQPFDVVEYNMDKETTQSSVTVKAENGFAIGLRIKELRVRRGLSQKDLVANQFSKSYISSIEAGRIAPSRRALEHFASLLGVSLEYLVQGQPVPAPGRSGRPSTSAMHAAQHAANNHAAARADLTGESLLRDDDQAFADDETDGTSAAYDPASYEAEQLTTSGERWEMLLLEARIYLKQNQFEQARGLLLNRFRVRQLNVAQLKQYYLLLGETYLKLNDSKQAQLELQRALDLATRSNDVDVTERARYMLGVADYRQNKILLAVEKHRLCLQAVTNGHIRDVSFKLMVYTMLANEYNQLNDYRQATEMYREVMALSEQVLRDDWLASAYWGLSQQYRQESNVNQARFYAHKSYTLYEAIENRRLAGQAKNLYGLILTEQNNPVEGEQALSEALYIAEHNNDPAGAANALINLSELKRKSDDLDAALSLADRGIAQARAAQNNGNQGNQVILGQALAQVASVYRTQENAGAAAGYFDEAVRELQAANAYHILARTYFDYGQTLNALGRHKEASEYFERAYTIQRSMPRYS